MSAVNAKFFPDKIKAIGSIPKNVFDRPGEIKLIFDLTAKHVDVSFAFRL